MSQALLIPFATFLIGVAVGFLAGWFAQKNISQSHVENWERALITIVVSFAWMVSVVLDMALVEYSTPVAVHGVMGMVVGYFFEGTLFNKNK
jgi:hypothetical protein